MIRSTKTLVLALTLTATLAVNLSATLGSAEAGARTVGSAVDDKANILTGIWESVAPTEVDCKTRAPFGPNIRSLYVFNSGGTMHLEDTLPVEGPFRSTGGGVWERVSGRTYRWMKMHYSFQPNTTNYTYTIRARGTLTLSLDGASFTQSGTFEVLDPSSQTPVYSGCFDDTAYRIKL